MSLVEIYLPQPVFVFSIQCVTQRSRLRVLLHFADNTYNFGVFVSVWQTAILLSVELSETRKKKIIQQARENLAEPTVRSRPPGGWPDQSIQARIGSNLPTQRHYFRFARNPTIDIANRPITSHKPTYQSYLDPPCPRRNRMELGAEEFTS